MLNLHPISNKVEEKEKKKREELKRQKEEEELLVGQSHLLKQFSVYL